MNLLHRILVATDFGRAGENAVRTACFVARQFDSQIYLVHVKSKTAKVNSDDWSNIDELIAERLNAMAEQICAQGVRNVETTVVGGSVVEQIDRLARQHNVNVIMIGAGVSTPSGEVYLGTTASRLRSKASQPVWIVKPDMMPPIHRVLCPVDYSPASSRALRNAIHLARGVKGVLTVLTVKQSLPGEFDGLLESNDDGDGPGTRLPEFEEFLRGFDFHGVHWRCMARRGKPQIEIPRIARETGAHLLVMGSVGRTGLSRMLIGGVARRVVQEMPCSVITVRQEDVIQLHMQEDVEQPDRMQCESRSPNADCARHLHGRELLEQGLADEALSHFEGCIAQYGECPLAWESLGESHARLGHERDARECRERADHIRQRQINKQIENEIRGRHTTHRPMFGIE